MSLGKTAAVTAGFLGAFGLGIWASPHLIQRTSPDLVAAIEPAPAVETPAAIVDRPTSKPRVARAVTSRTKDFAPSKSSVVVSAPELHERLKPLMKKGANMDIAAEGFNSAEQFATVVHASQNTDVPFMLLKHRVLNEGDTLVAAIRKSKPKVDAVIEADRARAEARSDLGSLD